jgi:hypothetical protein
VGKKIISKNNMTSKLRPIAVTIIRIQLGEPNNARIADTTNTSCTTPERMTPLEIHALCLRTAFTLTKSFQNCIRKLIRIEDREILTRANAKMWAGRQIDAPT